VRELAALEKAGHATRDRNGSPATWTARNVPEEAPGTDSPEALAWPHNSSIAAADAAPQGTEAPDTGDPDPEEDTGSAAPVDPAGIAPGAGEALGSAAAAAAQAEAALQAGDLAGALAASDHLTQAAARTQRLLRDAGRAARRGPTPPGELHGLVAAYLAAYPAEDFGPHAIGRVLGRSTGAVANALDRLTALGQAQLTSEAPRRYAMPTRRPPQADPGTRAAGWGIGPGSAARSSRPGRKAGWTANGPVADQRWTYGAESRPRSSRVGGI
jgi:hypothetical protein